MRNWVRPRFILGHRRLEFISGLRNAYINSGIVCSVGDSITAGLEYDEIIARRFGYHLIDKGIGGNTTIDVLSRMEDILSTNANVYTLAIGYNDIRYNNSSVGATNWNDYSQNMEKIISQLKVKADVYVLSIWPNYPSDEGSKLTWEKTNRRIDDYNNQLKSLCEGLGVMFINSTDAIREVVTLENHTNFVPDGNHPNEDGRVIYADCVLYGKASLP